MTERDLPPVETIRTAKRAESRSTAVYSDVGLVRKVLLATRFTNSKLRFVDRFRLRPVAAIGLMMLKRRVQGIVVVVK